MIFVTVGSLLPFDRLVVAMDRWAARHPSEAVFIQIGKGSYEPQHARWARKISPAEFKTEVLDARLIVAHAGMGTVITALERRKPIVIMPRHAALKEHTTDHQISTANWLRQKPGIFVAMSEAELDDRIRAALDATMDGASLSDRAPAEFVARVRSFLIDGENPTSAGERFAREALASPLRDPPALR